MPVSRPPQPRLPLLAAVAAALVGGALLAQAFPAASWWWAAFPGIALVLAALRGRTVRGALLVGFVAGETFYLMLIAWATTFLGPMPWAALATLETLFFMVGAVLLAWAQRFWPAAWAGSPRLLGLPLLLAGLWLFRELNASSWPYQGFAWGRVAQSQADGPLAPLVSWVSLSGVTFLVVALSAALAELGWALAVGRRPVRAGIGWAVAAVLLALVPVYRLPVTGSALVVGAQGGTEKAGFFFERTSGEVRAAHTGASALAEVQLDGRRPDLVVWPEGAAEPDPAVDAVARRDVAQLSQHLGAPVLVGAIHDEPDGRAFNVAQLWRGAELVGRYDKHRPVPFGEYVPDRALWSRFAPTEIAMIGREYTPGTTSPVLDLGRFRIGVGICFDVIDDELARQSVADGANLLVYPTNNADFAKGDELAQQVTFARLRALETGRSAVQVSTVGFTEAFDPSGHSLGRLPWYTQAALVVDVPLTSGQTPATRLGRGLEVGLAAAAMLALAGLSAGHARRRTGRGAPIA